MQKNLTSLEVFKTTTIVFLFAIFGTGLHELIHYITAVLLKCDPELFLTHITKGECTLLRIRCMPLGTNANYCLNDFLVTSSAPVLGLIISLLSLFSLKRETVNFYCKMIKLLFSLFFVRSSLVLLISDILIFFGQEEVLRLSDEDKIVIYLDLNPYLFEGCVHVISVLILIFGTYISGMTFIKSLIIPLFLGVLIAMGFLLTF